jgi:hypothetical protein
MKRFSRIVLWVLLAELVLGAAIGTRIRTQLERPTTYLGFSVAAEPLHVG